MVRVLLLSASLVAACGASPIRPTPTVRVAGDEADAIGRAVERDGAFVRVELHEGPLLWVEASRVSDLELAPGASVVVRDAAGNLSSAIVSELLDRTVVVTRTDGARMLVPLDRVLSALHAPLAPTDPTPVSVPDGNGPTVPTEATPDPRRFALRAARLDLFERVQVVSCAGGTARVLGPSGAPISVPSRDLSAPRGEVGDEVQAYWQSGETAYHAVVIGVNGRQVSLRYDDGSEEWLPVEMLASREGTAPGTAGCPRPGETHAMLRRGPISRVVEVLSCTSGTATVRAAGSAVSETAPLGELRALAVPPGARIEVLWQASSPYLAWSGVTSAGTVEATYDDGSVETPPLTDVRWIAHEPSGEAYVCLP